MNHSGRKRVGIYCPGTGVGGPWRYVHSLLAALDPAEFDATLFCDLPGRYDARPWVRVVRVDPGGPAGGREPGAPRPSGRRARRLVPRAAKVWAGFARDARRLARVFAAHRGHLLHTQNTGCEESPVAARLAGVPNVIGTFHVDPSIDIHRLRSGPVHQIMEAVSNRCLDVGIGVSRAAARAWVRRTPGIGRRVTTIHNGIDPDAFRRRHSPAEARRRLGLPTAGRVVGGVGRLEEAKGFGDLLGAAAVLRDAFPDLSVVLAGDGPFRPHLAARARDLGLADRVRFVGFQPDVQLALDALDVFAFPSWCETLGYALLEAMATGLPAVGAAVGGVPEVIVPGETGFLVPPRDPASLAAGLRPLLADAALRDRMGSAGRERVVRHFHERDMVRRTVQVYRDLLAGNRREVLP
jgi:glycosyltransferase involved in cell wall biosynthesis